MSTINYHQKKFRPMATSSNGDVNTELIFTYQQEGNILFCEYQGGAIRRGHLIGLVDENGNIDMRYHHVNQAGQLMTGTCQSRPEILPNGRIRLHETWQWTCQDHSPGESILEEM